MKRIEFISPEEFEKIYRAEKDKKMKLAILLGFASGLRISEIVGLKEKLSKCCVVEISTTREIIDGKKRKIHRCSKCNKIVNQNECKYSNAWKIPPLTKDKIDLIKHQIRLDVAKGGKWRITITPPNLTSAMVDLLPINMPRRTLQYKFDMLCKKVLDKKMSFHILRHGFGNYHANVLKTPLPMVQQMLGHARMDTTGIYTKSNPEEAMSQVWKSMTGETK